MSFQIKKNNDIVYGEFTEFTEHNIIAAISFRQVSQQHDK